MKGLSFFPSRCHRDDVRRRRELDVDPELVLEPRNLPQHLVALGHELDDDVDRRRPPADEHRGGTTGQVGAGFVVHDRSPRGHQACDARAVYGLTYAAARSKLTRRRTRAL
jgi:hypothetical protein